MYIPRAFRVDDPAALRQVIDDHPFATLITPHGAAAPSITHLPLEFEEGEAGVGGQGVLLGHVARANDHWQHFAPASADAEESVAIFHGPHAYVSPAWYAEHPAVPTWNYAVVHCHGKIRAIDDPERVAAVLDRLIERNESSRPDRWSAELPAGYRASLTRAIVAFELRIERVEGKFKLGQNRSAADRAGVLVGLESSSGAESAALAAFARKMQSD